MECKWKKGEHVEEKIKKQWEYLNNLGLYTIEDVIEFDKKLVLKIPKCDERSEIFENSTLDS